MVLLKTHDMKENKVWGSFSFLFLLPKKEKKMVLHVASSFIVLLLYVTRFVLKFFAAFSFQNAILGYAILKAKKM